MKRLLVLLTVMVGLLGFTTGAFAQAVDVCSDCKGGTVLGHLPCLVGEQACTPTIFDYQTRYGYDGESIFTPAATRYRAIFNICDCLDAGTTFSEGRRIGIRMTILVNGQPGANGAYWADTLAAATVPFGKYALPADTCLTGAWPGQPSNFGMGHYFLSDGTTLATPYTGGECAVPAAQRATILATDSDQGYTITAADVLYKLSRWWLWIPQIRIDPKTLKCDDVISVKIETLDQATGGICSTCVATCECTIEVAKACPCDGASSAACLFPYFTSTTAATAEQPFWNGIAIVNTSGSAGTATLTVYQKDGATGTFTTPSIPAHSMYVAALESIAFVGAGLGDVPLYISVETTFTSMDGFAMIANTLTGESMGYLCRK